MPKRNYEGDPLDMSWQDIKDRPHKGETVFGTSSDDGGQVKTEGLPDFTRLFREAAQESDIDHYDVLGMLEAALKQAAEKVEKGRVRDADNEKIRNQWVKNVGYLASQYRQLVVESHTESVAAQLQNRIDHATSVGNAIIRVSDDEDVQRAVDQVLSVLEDEPPDETDNEPV